MYELDHMLNGIGSRQHLQQMIRQAQQEKFACDAEAVQKKPSSGSRRDILMAVLNVILPLRQPESRIPCDDC